MSFPNRRDGLQPRIAFRSFVAVARSPSTRLVARYASAAASIVVSCGLFARGLLAVPRTDERGVMLFWFYAALALGLFLGERIVYTVYRDRIA
jgi:hypothetical protein